jgi:hypothetical protein
MTLSKPSLVCALVTYYKPHFGANSVYYTIVPNPF